MREKKQYIKPKLDIVSIENKDIIQTSGCGGDCERNYVCITNDELYTDLM